MKILGVFRSIIGIFAVLTSLCAQAYPGESIVPDPASGNYTITYWDDEEPASLEQTTFVPATKIIPTIRSKFRLTVTNDVVYSYGASNGAAAKQDLVGISLEQTAPVKGEQSLPSATATRREVEQAVFANMSALHGPKGWSGNVYNVRGISRIAWHPVKIDTGGIKPNRNQEGFGFTSRALPGISEARMEGLSPVFGYNGEGPAMDSAITGELERLLQNDFVARLTAVPTIVVPEPFDPAMTLQRIQAHMHTWIARQLIDSTFASQLDRYFQSAISAYRLNRPKVGKKHIQTMRELIHREYPNMGRDKEHESENSKEKDGEKESRMIGRLAARILEFDLKYVEMRMGGGGKDD